MPLSLRHKAVLGILLIEIPLVLLLIWIGSSVLVSAAATELTQRAQMAGQILAASSKNAVLALDIADLNQQVADMLRHPGVIYVRIVDRKERVLVEGGDPLVLSRPFRADTNYASVDDSVFDHPTSITVKDATHGRVELGFSVDEIAAARRDILTRSLFIGVILLVASVLFALVYGNYLTRAINLLKRGTAALASGNLGHQIPVSGHDELGEVEEAFNRMSQRLAEFAHEREQTQRQLVQLADQDSLTGLMNRRRFHDELRKWVQHAVRYQRPVSLLFIDMDQFKVINDTFGHAAGDRFLSEITALIKQNMRDTDIAGRLGGDEFGILLTETPQEGANLVAQRLLQSLHQADFVIESTRLHGSASIGIVTCPDHGADMEVLLARADIAMYRAKQAGRNRCHVFSDEDLNFDSKMRAALYWEERIKQALKEDRLVLLYQPIRSLVDGKHEAYEVLLRMRDDDGKLIAPGEFLETAERSGLIEQVDLCVVRLACNTQVQHRRAGRALNLSINLSGYQFNNLAVGKAIQDIIRETGAEAERLTFEITETSALENIGLAEKFIRRLRGFGCRFALDDFGAGYTSLSHLRNIPLDGIKIDGCFVQRLDQSPRDQALVAAVTDMGHALGLEVTAEFVENAQTLDILKNMGVDRAQGYHIGRPAALHREVGNAP